MSKQYDTNLEVGFADDIDDIDAASLDRSVEVQTEEVEGRQRQITAKIQIPHSAPQVWQVLTDYEALAEFIPNLAKSCRLEHPNGGIRLEQVGTQRLLRFNFSARVVLDLEERFPYEILTVRVWPKLTMPVALIERRLSSDLRLNLLAIRQRVEKLFGDA